MHTVTTFPQPPGRPPGFKGTVNREIDYSCSKCGAKPGKGNLLAKRIQFTTIGKAPKLVRSRVRAWLCGPCTIDDPDYKALPMSSPGFDDTKKDD